MNTWAENIIILRCNLTTCAGKRFTEAERKACEQREAEVCRG